MSEQFGLTPVYAGDVSGVASALYELGGMVVIHDPSGCNSTYNTHDEIRWYDKESHIFISGLNVRDATLGNDEKFMQDILDAAKQLKPTPKFIALCNSPVPFLNGTDFSGICRILQKKSGIPCFYVKTNGMHDYSVGAGAALKELADTFLVKNNRLSSSQEGVSVNILGMTPLDFGNPTCVSSLKEKLGRHGIYVNSIWAMDQDLISLLTVQEADVNLVVSSVGLPLAHYLQETFHMPYVIGAPIGAFAHPVYRALRDTATDRISRIPYLALVGHPLANAEHVAFIGEPILMESMAVAYRIAHPEASVCVYNALEQPDTLLARTDCSVRDEKELKSKLNNPSICFCDPMYAPILPESTSIRPVPTLAYSGRIHQADFPDYFAETFAV